MADIKILDVTLRDGGYRNNFNFTEDQARFTRPGWRRPCEIGYCKDHLRRRASTADQ
nr:hypothetical protein [Pseudomonas amygdali]